MTVSAVEQPPAEVDVHELVAPLTRLLSALSPPSAVRAIVETDLGYDGVLWHRLASELGALGVHVPAASGGAGLALAHAAAVSEQTGRALLPGPFFASACLATSVLLHCASEEQLERLLPPLLAGDHIATVAVCDKDGSWDPAGVSTTAVPDAGAYRICGRKQFVPNGLDADLLVVLAKVPGTADGAGVGAYVVDAADPRVALTPMTVIDTTRRQATVELDGSTGERLAAPGGFAAVERGLQEAAVLLAAECVGVAATCLDRTLSYARQREQFGRAIGSFQAVQHRLADMYGELESARALVEHAARLAGSVDVPATELALVSSASKARACDALSFIARETVQLHGGIGFTWEHDAHLYLKRSLSSYALLGTPSWHRQHVARLMAP